MTKFLSVINFSEKTQSAVAYLIKNSNSNNSPYHNFYHSLTVANGCLEASKFYDFNFLQTEVLVVAAIFHDFSHSMGKEKDDVNIKVAIAGMEKWASETNYTEYVDNIKKIINATQFPYVIPAEELSIRQQIIRDADLSQCLQDNWIQQIIFGLGEEMNKTAEEMINGQEEFLKSIKPNTEWFEKIWNERKEQLFEELAKLKETYSLK